MEHSSIPDDRQTEIQMVEGEIEQNRHISKEAAFDAAEDIVDRDIPAPASHDAELERIRRANPADD